MCVLLSIDVVLNSVEDTGILDKKMASPSKVATAFITIFGVAFVGLAGFVFTLHKKITDAKKTPLLD